MNWVQKTKKATRCAVAFVDPAGLTQLVVFVHVAREPL